MSSTGFLRKSFVTANWSERHQRTVYRVSVEGFSGKLSFNRAELEALRDNINLVLEDVYDRNRH